MELSSFKKGDSKSISYEREYFFERINAKKDQEGFT